MNVRRESWGGLDVHLVDVLDPAAQPDLAVVLCHGFGAPGTDLVPLGPELLQTGPELARHVQFVFPSAPLSLDAMGMPGGRAWWHLDVAQINAAIASGKMRDLRGDMPDGLVESRQMMLSMLDELRTTTGLPLSKIVLGGFSQGSMLATDLALRLDEPPAALCILSGTLLCEDEWRSLAEKRGSMPILQSHGDQDPILPFAAAEWLRNLFEESGLPVQFISFTGGHTIPAEALSSLASLLSDAADDAG